MLGGKSPHYSDEARVDLRHELDQFELQLAELKVHYEQYFTGLHPLPPDKPHAAVKQKIRTLRKAPFKSSAITYRFRALETRYNTLNTYWQRVLKEREAGTYFKDVFKANLREKIALEEAFSHTAEGAAEKGVRSLFDAYRSAVEKHNGVKAEVDFSAFRDSLLKRAHDFREQHADKKLTFKVVVKEGKVSVKAVVKEVAAKGGENA